MVASSAVFFVSLESLFLRRAGKWEVVEEGGGGGYAVRIVGAAGVCACRGGLPSTVAAASTGAACGAL